MPLINETDFGERLSRIKNELIKSLNELQYIIDKSLPHSSEYSRLEGERLRQQDRANREAVRCARLEEALAEIQRHSCVNGECTNSALVAIDMRKIAREALRYAAPNAQASGGPENDKTSV